MKITISQFAWTVALLTLFAAAAPAQVTTNNLVFEANANDDNDGSDGWDYTQPAVGGAIGLLPVSSANAPTHGVTLNGGGFFNSDGASRHFAGSVTPVKVLDFSYELWLRRRGANTTSEQQIGSFRKLQGFGGDNFLSFAMNSGNPQGVDDQLADVDFKDETGVRAGNLDQIPIPIDKWMQVVITYSDVTAPGLADGIMNVYTNGNPAPVASFGNNVHMGGGDGADMEWVETHVINSAESDKSWPGDIAIVRIYNAVLTPAEVTQNFQADGGKYGLIGSTASPPELESTRVTDAVGFVFTADVPGLLYELECSDDGVNFIQTGAIVRGTGAKQILFDPRGTPTQAFYRITDNAP